MSEFPVWVERTIGLALSYQDAERVRADIQLGLWPDPRGRCSGERIWWRHLWLFDRRKRMRLPRYMNDAC